MKIGAIPTWLWLTAALAIAAVALLLSWALDGPEVSGDRVALTEAREAILARRLLMNAIGTNNDVVHDTLDGVLPYDGHELQGRLASISAMMRAFPSLYRAAPDPWTAEAEAADPIYTSLALPTVWEEFDAFEAMAMQSWQTASDASHASGDEMLALVNELEAQCEACHERYRRPFTEDPLDRLPFPDEESQ